MNRALCIGINDYPGIESDLRGCVNDANDWADELRARGFQSTTLLDRDATKAKILAGMEWVVRETQPGEVGVITYSGHGTWLPDADGDEPDGRDEALCPYDLIDNGPILDDDLYEVFVQQNPGARIVFVSDSCFSGGMARRPRDLIDTSLASPAGRFLPPEEFIDPSDRRTLERARLAENLPIRGVARNTALLMAGCGDSELSYDAQFGGRDNGAFTYVALKVLRQLGPTSYRNWINEIRNILPTKNYPQTPRLAGTCAQKGWEVFDNPAVRLNGVPAVRQRETASPLSSLVSASSGTFGSHL